MDIGVIATPRSRPGWRPHSALARRGSSARAQQIGVTVADVPRSSTKSIDLEENASSPRKMDPSNATLSAWGAAVWGKPCFDRGSFGSRR